MVVLRQLSFQSSAEFRTEEFAGRQYLVVPVVALMEGVIQAVNAPKPELVTAEELSKAPQGWAGRPVTAGHPFLDGIPTSANIPEILEKHSFGVVFNPEMHDKKLVLEAWLDTNRAAILGGLAQEVVERINNKEIVEVSVGAFITLEDEEGDYNGKHYSAVWRGIVPDHLAMLSKTSEGACSVEMGCGAARAAEAALRSSEMPKPETKKRTLKERLFALMSFRSEEVLPGDVSDNTLRDALSYVLKEAVQGLLWIEAVFVTEGKVVYARAEEGEYEIETYQRSFTVAADGSVALLDDAVEVRPVTTYVPAIAGEESTTESAELEIESSTDAKVEETTTETVVEPAVAESTCPCDGRVTPDPINEGVVAMKEKVAALIACPKNTFTEADAPWLENVPEAHLDALIAAATKPEPVVEPVVAAAAPKPQTEEEFLALAPESIRTLVQRQKNADAKQKTELVAAMKGVQTEFSEAELAEMSIEQLSRLARLTKVEDTLDFSGRAFPRAAAKNENDVFLNPPDPYKLALDKRASA
jgi:Uncharacterized protein conserved in bacteria (DUF2213)